jgi:hypothetical protein
MNRIAIVACAALLGCGVLPFTHATRIATAAELPAPNVDSPELIRQALNQNVGKRVKVKLLSGQDLEGKLGKVGSYGIVLTELTGMEFFEATLRLEQIAAVIVRSAGK